MTRKQILLVEDDPYSEMVITRILNRIEVPQDVTWVKSVPEAEAQLIQHQFDLIIADIFLEGERTGLDFWQSCSEKAPQTPFVVVSGLPIDKFFLAIGREAIAPPYIPKPVDVAECRQLLQSFLGEVA
jgi:CheY-like chemotaxis protein